MYRIHQDTDFESLAFIGIILVVIALSNGCAERDADPEHTLQSVIVSVKADASPKPLSYNRDIRPILSDKCFACHGPDAGTREADLRLDVVEDGEDYFGAYLAIEPGDPDNSELINRIHHTKSRFVMPPPDFGGVTLSDEEKALLQRWIKEGAEYEPHWAFTPISKPNEPSIADASWSHNKIDLFVLHKLEQRRIRPSPAAPLHTLLRRVALDVTGLPPDPQRVEQLLMENDAEKAYQTYVDELLDSPRFGERMASIWLDAARYADTNGHLQDHLRTMWPWRDWVINAYNNNLPYDQFIRDQIAGDLLPEPTPDQLIATGFNRNHGITTEGGSIDEEFRVEYAADRTNTMGAAILSLTLECARCHDHKYDPIPQTDYYALAGVFFNTIYEEYPQAPKKVVDEFKKIEDQIDEKERILQELQRTLTGELARSLSLQTSNYLMGVWEVTGKQKKEMALVVNDRRLDYELLDRWIKYMAKPTTRYHNKDEWQALMKKGGGTQQEAKKLADKFQQDIVDVTVANDEIDVENRVINDKDVDGTKPKKQTDKPSNFVSNKDFNPGALLRLKSLPEDQTAFWTEIFVRELKDNEDPNDMVEMDPRKMSPGVLLFRAWGLEHRIGPESQARVKSLEDDLEALKKKLDPYYPFVHGVKDSASPVNIQLALRGNPETLGAEVPRHFLSIFSEGVPAALDQGSGRMQLAELIVKQPIAMRVIANRIWKADFGTGTVELSSSLA